MAKLTVVVPRTGSAAWHTILPKSGVVSSFDATPGMVRIDYEGARFGQVGMARWADRVEYAAGRHVTHYPTTARMFVAEADVEPVAVWDTELRTLELLAGAELAVREWLHVEDLEPELRISGPMSGFLP